MFSNPKLYFTPSPSLCASTTSHLHDSVQQSAQHISPSEYGSLHSFQLHDHSIYFGHDAAD